MRAKGQIEFYHFEGAAAINGTLDNAAAVDRTSSYDHNFYGKTGGVVDVPITGHGYTAGPNNYPSLIYIQGSTNYDGLRRIVSIPDADTIRIVAAYVAETFGGSEVYFPGVTFEEPWIVEGFDIHLSAAGGAAENFTVDVDSPRGAEYDVNLFTEDFNTVKDYIKTFDDPVQKREPDDILKAAYANTNNRTWSMTYKVRRIA